MPRTANHEEQRRRIAEATWAVIQDRGPAGATVREIARAAGCTTGTLSHYFRNRAQLIAFAFDLVVSDLCDQVTQRAGAANPGRERLEVLIEEFLPRPGSTDPTATVTLAAWAQAASDPALAQQHRTNYDRLRTLATGYTTEAIATGDLPPDMPAADAADLIISFADGLCVACLLESERHPYQRRSRLTQRFLDQLSLPRVRTSRRPG